ncbi:MAG TPA: ABC transporter permease [Candidatus Acidoferrum sp.]|nr:ABC transporter permease [Candidatus Acidoferrum sp.]
MVWAQRFLLRLQSLFLRNQNSQRLNDEMQFHLDQQITENLAAGMSFEDARHAAMRTFGNATVFKEETRDTWGWTQLQQIAQDFRYGLRTMHRAPGLSFVAILTLSLGIAANTAVFSWIHSVLLDPLPGARQPERVFALESVTPAGDWVPASYPDYRDTRDYTKLFDSFSVSYPMTVAVGNDRAVEQLRAELVSGSFFDLLRVRPEAGRLFVAAENNDAQNAHPVVVISHGFWASHYQKDPSAIGSTIRINRQLYTIVGVAPDGFCGSMPGLAFQMWALATMHGQLNATGDWMLQDRKARMFRVLARPKPDVTYEQALAEVQAFGHRMAEAHGDTNQGMGLNLLPMWKSHYGIQEAMLGPLTILMATAGMLLLIVCANVANLLLARATSRQKEFSVRLALGAGRARLIRQVLTESFLFALIAALFGLALAYQFTGGLQYLFPAGARSWLSRPPMDPGVLLFTLALTLGIAILAGVAPALHAAGENVNETLKESGRMGTSSRHSQRLRNVLVVAEMGLAVVALIGAGLFVKSFRMARAIHPGFEAKGVAIAQFHMSSAGYDRQQADSFCQRLREQLEREPGVTAVSYADYVPLSLGGNSWEDLQIEGYVPGPSENMKIYRSLVAPGYFAAVKIPLLEGRDFTLQDDRDHDPVMIVNQEFVRRFLRNQYPIGVKVRGWGKWFRIVGVAQDSKIMRPTEGARPFFYVPIRQIYQPEMTYTFFVRTSGSISDAMTALRRDARAVDAASAPLNVTALEEFILQSLFTLKIAADLLTILAGMAIFLTAIGLYSVMAYSVARRTHEIGIRMSLGARASVVVGMVIRQGLLLGITGLAAGTVAAMTVAPLLRSSLVSVSPADPVVYVAAAGFALVIVLAATAIPARRAMRVDPMVALRYE